MRNFRKGLYEIYIRRIGSLFFVFSLFFLISYGASLLLEWKWEWPKVHSYTLKNGNRTLELQWMYHIGTKKFYESIRNNVLEKKNDGYIFFLEKLWSGSSENERRYVDLTWYDENFEEVGASMGDARGLIKQNYDFIIKDTHISNIQFIDLNMDQLIHVFDTQYSTGYSWWISASQYHISAILFAYLTDNISDFGRGFFRNLSIIPFVLQPSVDIDSPQWENLLSDLNLNFRDDYVAQKIIDSPAEKICVLYGEWHMPGIYRNLKKSDPNWTIISQKEYRVFWK